MNLTLETITSALDYRAGEAIDDWLARTGLTPNHMRAALNELKLFEHSPLPYEPDRSGYIPTHEDLSAAWKKPSTAPPQSKPGWKTPWPAPDEAGPKDKRPAREMPWWQKGRAAAAQRAAASDQKPRWWEKSRTADEIAGRALTPEQIEQALEEIYRRTDLTFRGTFGEFCDRNDVLREDVIEIFRLDQPDCRYRFSCSQPAAPQQIDIDQRLAHMYDAVDLITGESWAAYCRRRGITREDMIASIRSFAHGYWPNEPVKQSRERVPSWRPRPRGRDYER